MVKVTDKDYYMDKKLKQKLDLMINRATGNKKGDNLILCEGDEGAGKSTIATAIGYYVAYHTGKSFSMENVFFDAEKLVEFAKKHEGRVIIYDESVTAAQSSEWWKKEQRDLITFLQMARKKRHFYIFCVPKFFRLNEYLVVDRSIGMVHVYFRRGVEIGNFAYFKDKAKEELYDEWRRRRKRTYKKHYSFRGRFTDVLDKLISEEEYDKKKEAAIQAVGNDGKKKREISAKEIRKIRDKILTKFFNEAPEVKQKSLCKVFNLEQETMSRLKKKLVGQKMPNL